MKKFLMFCCIFFSIANTTFANDLPVTSQFGWREHPISGGEKFHSGVDLAYDEGTPIPALFEGDVIFADEYGGYGNIVYLYHAETNTYTGYGHCSSFNCVVGQHVQAGDIIAFVGSTGYSTGPHLHLEYIFENENGVWQYGNPLELW